MRNVMLMAGLCCAVALSLGACGSDVATTPTGSTSSAGGSSSSAGGAGGAPTVSSSTVASSSSTGGPMNSCEEACEKIAVECGLPGACDMPIVQQYLDCSDPMSECPGLCILDAECAAIFSLANFPNSDPALTECILGCQGGQGGAGGGGNGCQGCLLGSCQAELAACVSDTASPCAAFANCASMCTNGDGACYSACAQSNPSAETTALESCATSNCGGECGLSGTGGAGGAGGAGGGN